MLIAITQSAADQPESDAKIIRCSVPTPKNWNQESIIEAFRTAGELNGWVCLSDPVEWWQASKGSPSDAKVFKDQQWQNVLIKQNNLRTFIQLDPYKSPRRGTLATKLPPELAGMSFASPKVREAFIAEAIARTKWFKPQFVCLAMEINAYYEQQPQDFENFISLFVETRKAVKGINTEAVVFVSFQYEQLLGRFGGIEGQTRHSPHWEVLEMFEPHQDAVGISSYPLETMSPLRFGDPDSLPDDYYARIKSHTKKPIIFAEMGWSSDSKFGSSQSNQARFLSRFEELTKDLDLLLVNHFFLYDCPGFGEIFDSMGLLDQAGKPKMAYGVWKSLWN